MTSGRRGDAPRTLIRFSILSAHPFDHRWASTFPFVTGDPEGNHAVAEAWIRPTDDLAVGHRVVVTRCARPTFLQARYAGNTAEDRGGEPSKLAVHIYRCPAAVMQRLALRILHPNLPGPRSSTIAVLDRDGASMNSNSVATVRLHRTSNAPDPVDVWARLRCPLRCVFLVCTERHTYRWAGSGDQLLTVPPVLSLRLALADGNANVGRLMHPDVPSSFPNHDETDRLAPVADQVGPGAFKNTAGYANLTSIWNLELSFQTASDVEIGLRPKAHGTRR